MSDLSKKNINIGNQSNDGTGDSIRDAFSKANDNFEILFNAAGLGTGLRMTNLVDSPRAFNPASFLVTDQLGTTVTQFTLVTGTGIAINLDYTTNTLTIDNTASRLYTDTNPYLSANLSGSLLFRAVEFTDPQRDQDLVTKAWVHDNFLNRDSNYVTEKTFPGYITTSTEGSTLRHNIRLSPSAATTSTNVGKSIKVWNASHNTSTVDLSLQAVLGSHLTRKDYVDTKISLQGISTLDPATGELNPGFGQMTGALQLFRDPTDDDDGLTAATRNYVDENTFWSDHNFFVTQNGRDHQPDVPAYKRGRNWQYAFASVNKAAQYADAIIEASEIEVGDYARLITYDSGTPATVISSADNYDQTGLSRLTISAGADGSDQFGNVAVGKYTIYPGQYIQGEESQAIALIESIASTPGDPGLELYTIQYVDYGDDFHTDITASNPLSSSTVVFSFVDTELVPIPDFWIGQQFYTDEIDGLGNVTYTSEGVITSLQSTVDQYGLYHSAFTVEFSSGSPGNGVTIDTLRWHVYSGDFLPGEKILYNTNVSAKQITIVLESGEFYEQLPIKLAANVSIRGDEFRRCIIRPARGLSSSKWATTYFRRDTQVDQLQSCALNTSTNYAPSVAVTPAALSDVVTLTLASGSLSDDYLGYMFVSKVDGGQGVIKEINSTTFNVQFGTNLDSTNTIPSGSWAIYEPINFGYHYLRDPSRPLNVLTTQTNLGAYDQAASILSANKTFIQAETLAWLTSTYPSYTFDTDIYYRSAGNIVDGLTHDLIYSGSGKTVDSANNIINNPSIGTASTCSLAVNHINTVAQKLLAYQTVTPSTGNTESQVSIPGAVVESGAPAIVVDLIQAAVKIINSNPAFNPPKDNGLMDIFLMNDANVIRYISCQNHGGFMQVLDPAGQIKNKSPYTQTASSFSQSIAKHAFRGGMLVDGFSGNVLAYTATTVLSNPIEIPVKGLVRRPQVPTFFLIRGVRYEVDFFSDFLEDSINTGTYTATLNLNPLKPGGIPNTVSVPAGAVGFKASQSNIPIVVDQPTGIGGIVATGYATSNGSGNISSIVIDFPGAGYITAPYITIGGAVINNLVITNGTVANASIGYGGAGYSVSTVINIVPVGAVGVTTATFAVTSVDSSGSITGIAYTNSGTGWTSSISYRTTFGTASVANSTITAPTPIIGYIDTLPTKFELITAGNRSMLANDFTQINDLGYGIFVTNGGFMENVSMFTYYCYRSYYALNGSQVRTTTGSSCYGEWGLCAEGSDPNEVPTAVSLVYPLTQIASAYVVGTYLAQPAQTSIYVVIDLLNGGYAPFSGSEVEINHDGYIQVYNVGSAVAILDSNGDPVNGSSTPVYQLSFASGATNQGLIAAVTNGTKVSIRTKSAFKFTGLNPETVSRPSTSLTFNDDVNEIYHVTEYTAIQPDSSVIAYTLEDYFYIGVTAQDQGLTYPKITNTGSGYVSATVTIGTGTLVSAVTTASGAVSTGSLTLSVQNITNIKVGQTVSGTNIDSSTLVKFINTTTKTIGISTPVTGYVSATSALSFNAVSPVATAVIANGGLSAISITNGGAGWSGTTTTISVSGSAVVTSPINIAGVIGSRTIKISTLTTAQGTRIQVGISNSKYYQVAVNGQLLNITGYRSSGVTGQTWDEIDVDQALTTEVAQGTNLKIGLPKNSPAKITTRISLLRATGHDFVDIGTGGYADTRIPNDLYGPPINQPSRTQQVKEIGTARVYWMSTDQDGYFRVGKAFEVDQAHGTVSINAPISLQGIESISLKRDLGPAITEFSTDNTMNAIADYKVPTEQAVVYYINRRLGIDQAGKVYTGNVLGGGVLALNGANSMAASLNMGSHNITDLSNPRIGQGQDAATKSYVDQRIEKRGTLAKDVDGTTDASTWGVMTGPLQLVGDPTVITTSTVGSAILGTTTLSVAQVSGAYRDLLVTGPGIPANTFVTSINISSNSIGISNATTAIISSGTVLTLDPVVQAATKGYVDKHTQFNQLRDVSLSNATDKDLVMFNSTVLSPQSSSGTTAAIYNTATQIVNVANNTATITNTSSANGGGSDITITRSANTVTFKLVGGLGANNPITDYHVNNSAAIAQSKLLMNKATVSGSASGAQGDLGLAQFNNNVFTSNNGWIDLGDAGSTSSGIARSKLQWIPAGGGLLGSASGVDAAVGALTSSTVRAWLNVLGLSGGTLSGDITVNNIYTNAPGYSIGSAGTTFGTIYVSTVSATTLNGSGSGITAGSIKNSSLTSSTITVNALTALGGGGTVSLGGSINLTNLGVTSIAGTANQILVNNITSSNTGSVTLSLPSTISITTATLTRITSGSTATSGSIEGQWTLTSGSTLQATYADLAEWYTSDEEYAPGTVVVFGGSAEVTTTTLQGDARVAGVVTTDPAYIMNTGLEGTKACLALIGRVPVKVVGTARKGDMLTASSEAGYATATTNPQLGAIIGKALEDKTTPDKGVIQVAVGRM